MHIVATLLPPKFVEKKDLILSKINKSLPCNSIEKLGITHHPIFTFLLL
jgi:hypothetical protein